MTNSEHITHEAHDPDAWVCLCGNTPPSDGFATCNDEGAEIEPTLDSGWTNLLVCLRCGRIINQDSLMVIGRRSGLAETADPKSQAYRFAWRGIEIEVTYTPRKWTVIDHLEIRSVRPERAPLPITNTGFCSHFMQPGTIEAHGGDVVAQVTAWLDEEAAKPEWLAHIEACRQGELF